MVGKMHETMMEDRPAEEERLDQAMTTMDPILKASLKREQQQRFQRNFFYGGLAMAVLIGLIFAVLMNQDSKPEVNSESSSNVANGATVKELEKEGWSLRKSGDQNAAEAKFNAALKIEPEDADLWNGLGWSQIGQQKFDLALESFNRCLRYERSHAAGLNGVGQSFLAKHEYDLAELYLRAAEKNGATAATWGLARIYLLQGKYDLAKTTLQNLDTTGMDKELIDAMVEAARTKTLDDALRSKLEPAELSPDENVEPDRSKWSAGGLAAKGWNEFRHGNNAAAEKLFRMAVEKDPKMDSALNGLGFALLNQGDTEEAQPIFERLVKVDPKHGGYVNGLARCYESNGELLKAVEIWKTQEKGAGPPDALTWGIARSLFQLEKYDDALPYLKRIKAAGGDDLASVEAMIAKCEAAK